MLFSLKPLAMELMHTMHTELWLYKCRKMPFCIPIVGEILLKRKHPTKSRYGCVCCLCTLMAIHGEYGDWCNPSGCALKKLKTLSKNQREHMCMHNLAWWKHHDLNPISHAQASSNTQGYSIVAAASFEDFFPTDHCWLHREPYSLPPAQLSPEGCHRTSTSQMRLHSGLMQSKPLRWLPLTKQTPIQFFCGWIWAWSLYPVCLEHPPNFCQ